MAYQLMKVETPTGEVVHFQVDSELKLDEGQEGQAGFDAAGLAATDQIRERFDDLAKYIADRSGQFIGRYQELAVALRPGKVALEFAVGIEGNVGIPFIASGKGSANVTITAEWESSSAGA